MSSKIYTLYLSTLITTPVNNLVVPINKTNLANVSWLIDFNGLFNGDQHKFRRCTMRHKLTSEGWVGADGNWEAYTGILCCTLPSSFTASTTNGTVLGLLYPTTLPTGGTRHCYVSDTFGDQNGVEINMPSGVVPVSFSIYNDDAMTFINNPSAPNWQILIHFELSDPIETPNMLGSGLF
jgi:hypothetical protein